jgi:Sporulation and spore germination
MKWGRFAILALALVVSACGEQGGGSLESTSNEEECRGRFRTGPRDEGTGTFTYEVWFAGSGGFLSVSKRQTNLEPEAPKVPKLALDSLLAGPSEAEAAAGVFTAVPAGTELLHLDIEDGIAMVDLSSEYEQGSGSWGESLRLAQVVYTLTQFETVETVDFRLEGEPVKLFGGRRPARPAAGPRRLPQFSAGPKLNVDSPLRSCVPDPRQRDRRSRP